MKSAPCRNDAVENSPLPATRAQIRFTMLHVWQAHHRFPLASRENNEFKQRLVCLHVVVCSVWPNTASLSATWSVRFVVMLLTRDEPWSCWRSPRTRGLWSSSRRGWVLPAAGYRLFSLAASVAASSVRDYWSFHLCLQRLTLHRVSDSVTEESVSSFGLMFTGRQPFERTS